MKQQYLGLAAHVQVVDLTVSLPDLFGASA
jgi:hypothetical protein